MLLFPNSVASIFFGVSFGGLFIMFVYCLLDFLLLFGVDWCVSCLFVLVVAFVWEFCLLIYLCLEILLFVLLVCF